MKRTFEGHARAITEARFSPDGTRLVTASTDGTAKAWELATGKRIATYGPHLRAVRDLALSPDGKLVATVGDDYGVYVWDADTGTRVALGKQHTAEVRHVSFSPSGETLATGSDDGSVRLWPATFLAGDRTAQPRVLRGHTDGVDALAFTSETKLRVHAGDGRVFEWNGTRHTVAGKSKATPTPRALTGPLAYGFQFATHPDGTVTITNPDRADSTRLLGGHDDSIAVAIVSPNGERLVTCGDDGSLVVWDWRAAANDHTLAALPVTPPAWELAYAGLLPDEGVPDAAFVGNELVLGRDSILYVIDPPTGRVLRELRGESAVLGLRHGTAIFSDWQASIELVAVATGASRARFLVGEGRTPFLASGDLAFFSQSHAGSVLHLVDLASAAQRATFGPFAAVEGDEPVVTTAEGRRAFLAASAPHGWVLDPATSQVITQVAWDGEGAYSAALTPDGATLIVGARDGKLYAFDTQTGARRPGFLAPPTEDSWVRVQMSPRGDRVITHGNPSHALVWDVATGKLVGRLFGDQTSGYIGDHGAVFSPDGTRIITAHARHPLLRFYDAQSMALVASHDVHRGGMHRGVSFWFYAGGTRVLTAGGASDNSIRAWDVGTGERLFSHLGMPNPSNEHDAYQFCVVSPDQRYAAFGLRDYFSTRVLDLRDGTLAAELPGHTDYLRDPAFSLDNQWLVTGSNDHTYRVWRVPR